MKVLKIKAFQEMACYTKPFANKVAETYPLPPYATVKGMIHKVLKAEQYIPFSLSIQGDYETIIVDYRKTYLLKSDKFKKGIAMPIIMDGLAMDVPNMEHMTSMPLYTHMLYHINLIFHVYATDSILEQIWQAFQQNDSFPSLGRHEDLLRIDSINFVEISQPDMFEGVKLKHSMYIPYHIVEEDEQSKGIPYLLNWTYQLKNGIREWNRIPTGYFPKGTLVNDDLVKEPIYVDLDGDVVVWNQ